MNFTSALYIPECRLRNTPYFKDCCEHPEGSYIGSAEWIHQTNPTKPLEKKKLDVYLFPDADGIQHVCIRTGAECHEYISPGTFADFMFSCALNGAEAYRVALKVINSKRKILAT